MISQARRYPEINHNLPSYAGMGGNDSLSLDSDVELRIEEEQFDRATYVAALAFNNAALPSNMPEWLKAAIEARADELRSDPGNIMLIDAAATREFKQKQADEANEEFVSQIVQIAQQQEREREEWAHTKSTVAGVTMTGAEWAELAQRLKNDDSLRQEVLDLFIQRGMTREQAERRYDRIQAVAEAASVPPSQRSEDQKRVISDANADPTIMRDLQDVAALAEKNEIAAKPALHGAFESAVNNSGTGISNPQAEAPAPKAAAVELSGPGF